MYKRCFFKCLFFFLLTFFVGGFSPVLSLNPSYLFLGNNRINTSNINMVLLVTPSKSFSSGSQLTISFPDADDGKWCKQNNVNLTIAGVTTSIVDTGDWTIDAALPGTLMGKCYKGSGFNSHDRVVISGIGNLSAGVSYGVRINASGNLSTGSSIGSNNIIVELERGFVRDTTAFAVYLQGLSGLVVDAFVNEDTFSTVQVLDPVVEKGIWSRIRVRILNSQGQPLAGRTIQLGLNIADLTNWEIEQPVGVTNSNGVIQGRIRGLETGVVTVTAVDKSLSQDVYIKDTDLLTVVNVPTITLHTLPMYTSGLSREITWNLLSGSYQYYIEASLDPSFGTIFKNSGWINQGSYTFEDLEHGKAYYYRGKARNIANFESAYSNIVSSIQADALSSVVEVLDPVVEKGIWSRVRATVLDQFGNPVPNRKVEFRIDAPNMANWEIEQPVGVTNSNGVVEGRIRGFEVRIVRVTAVDTTMPEIQYLDGFDWLQVTELPSFSLHRLPIYSKGLSRQITWNSLGGNYQYYIEISTNSNFTNIIGNSGWISLNQFVFQNLTDEQTYFYRGKIRNSARQESRYSEIVFSTQDNKPPSIERLSFDFVSDKASFVFLITDFSRVSSVNFRCRSLAGDLFNCGSLSSLGNFYYVTLLEDSLLDYKINENDYLLRYCIQATDIVGNQGEFCDEESFSFEDMEEIEEEEEEEEEVVEKPKTFLTRVTDGLVPIQKTLEDVVVYLQNFDIDDEMIGTASLTFVSSLIPLTFLSFLLNPALLQALIAFLLFFGRRKKALPYGYVYDAVTKEPINKAIIRIFKEKKLFRTTVSDVYGIFTAELEPGQYYMKVVANGYVYPTKLITTSTDSPYENIYRGGKFLVKEDTHIQYSIPLDPIDSSHINYAKALFLNRLGNFFLALQKIFIGVGLLVAFILYIRTPDTLNLIIFLFYIPLLFLHLILSFNSVRVKLGIVRDTKNILLHGVELGLREMEFEKLIAKRVTDKKGRYKFLVAGGEYKLEVLTPGFSIKNFKEKDFFFKGSVKKPLLVNKNLVLERK